MEEKTARQVHQERHQAVQKVLDSLLAVVHDTGITEGRHLNGKDDRIVVTMTIWPKGSRVRNLYFESGPGIMVTHGKNDLYAIEYDADTFDVVDTTIFDGEVKGAGRIHFTYPGLGNTIGEAAKLATLIKSVKWNLG